MASLLIDSGPLVDDALANIVVVSRNAQLRSRIEEQLVRERWHVSLAGNGTGVMDLLCRQDFGDCVLLIDSALPDLEQNLIAERFPRVQTLLLNSQTGQILMGADRTAVSTKLIHTLNSRGVLTFSNAASTARVHPLREPARIKLRGMIGNAEAMQRIWAMTRKVAAVDTTVLITGESGTGKDLLAQEIHCISARRNQPFITVNCSHIPESLLEIDLFGYEKGAFTGAVEPRVGRIHAAHGGTLFLNAIGDMPLAQQSKLLRFLDQREVQRLGDKANLKVDVRVIAAANTHLEEQVKKRRFRKDLYHRLTVFPLHLPPLRERMQDVEELAQVFAAKFLTGAIVSPQALQLLARHSWPGNIRELSDVIERATLLAGAERKINLEHIVF